MTTCYFVNADDQLTPDDCAMYIERLEALRDQLVRSGPEHFYQGSWFELPDMPRFELERLQDNLTTGGLDIDRLKEIDINNCGATACLAGHGALVMAHGNKRAIAICSEDVAVHFGIPSDWFLADINGEHPGFELGVDLEDRGAERPFADWMAQLFAIQHRINAYAQRAAELYEAE